MTAPMEVMSTTVFVRAGSATVATVFISNRGVMELPNAATDQMKLDAPTSVMPPSSDVIEMETVLTSLKYVTKILIAGMEVMSSTALTPAMSVGLKGNIIFYAFCFLRSTSGTSLILSKLFSTF